MGNVYQNIPRDSKAIQAFDEVVGPGPGNDLAKFLSGEVNLKRCWNETAVQKYTVLKVLRSSYASRLREDIDLHKCELDLTGIDLDALPSNELSCNEFRSNFSSKSARPFQTFRATL